MIRSLDVVEFICRKRVVGTCKIEINLRVKLTVFLARHHKKLSGGLCVDKNAASPHICICHAKSFLFILWRNLCPVISKERYNLYFFLNKRPDARMCFHHQILANLYWGSCSFTAN